MPGWFDFVSATIARTNPPTCRAFPKKRLMGFEPTTFCMAIRPVIWRVRYQNLPICRRFSDGVISAHRRRYARICGCSYVKLLPQMRRQGASLSVDGGLRYLPFRIDQQPPDSAGQVAFEAAQSFAPGLPLGLLSLEELPRRRVDASLADSDPVQGAV